MSTNTLRLPAELRERISRLSKESGTTVHKFMLEAIAERFAGEEWQRGFVNEGNTKFANMLANGFGIDWADMRDYLDEGAAGDNPSFPEAKRWR